MNFIFLKNFFQNYPRLANSTVYGFLYVGAECSQQIITKKLMGKHEGNGHIDYNALGRYLVVGSVINSNYLYSWYKWLDGKYVGTKGRIIVKKVLLDQFVMTPPLYFIFYVSMSFLEGKENLLEECKTKFVPTFLMSCLFWLPAQTINFIYLPGSARIVYMGVCSFVWMNFLCWMKARNKTPKVKFLRSLGIKCPPHRGIPTLITLFEILSVVWTVDTFSFIGSSLLLTAGKICPKDKVRRTKKTEFHTRAGAPARVES